MEFNFENRHVVAIVVFMVALLFCKNLLQCVQACMEVWRTCAESMCLECQCIPCVHFGHMEALRWGLSAALLTFSVGQPLLLLLVKNVADMLRQRQSFWTVNFVHCNVNVSAFAHKRSGSLAPPTVDLPHAISVSQSESNRISTQLTTRHCGWARKSGAGKTRRRVG